MRKESSTVQKCKRQMATLGFDSQLAYHRVKLILKIYRDVVWVLSERVEELREYAWELGAQDADTGLNLVFLSALKLLEQLTEKGLLTVDEAEKSRIELERKLRPTLLFA